MNQKTRIKKQTEDFINQQDSKDALVYFEKIKTKSQDFNSSKDKIIFWEQAKILMTNKLKEHRDNYHKGQPAPNCKGDIRFNKIIELIEEELH